MEIELTTFLIVCPLVFLAGFVDSIAGGGGIISLPAYLLAGIPVHNALATNKLSSLFGAVAATLRFWRNNCVDALFILPSVLAALMGSAMGTRLLLLIDERYLQYILMAVLPITAYYILRKKKSIDIDIQSLSKKQVYSIAAVISFFLGAYDGFYGPGTGTFLILLYTGLAKMDVRTAAGNSKFVNLASNTASFVVFMVNGKVLFTLGLTAALFSIAGSYIGAGLVIKRGSNIVRPIILVVLALLFVKIIYEQLQ